uniref:Uncharacterized protein n=1 Tax=Anguilla anguilla TaxID=7936 RepID=A0A0E9TDM8_ANGAN
MCCICMLLFLCYCLTKIKEVRVEISC